MKRFLALLLLAPSLALAFATATVTVNVSASPTTVPSGGTSTITWSSANATSCSASGLGQSGAIALSGSAPTPALTATTTITITCKGRSTVSKSVTITVTAPPPPPPADTDGDGVPNSTDQCPTQAGPAPSGCPVTPPPPPPTGGDICATFPSDKTNRPLVLGAKPAVGAAFTDPAFGSKIRRVTNAQGRGKEYVKTMYSTVQAWNADESRMLLLGAGYIHELYDGRTYALIRVVDDINPADGEQVYWDTSDPQILYYADPTARTFVKYNVESKLKTVMHDFKTAPTSCSADLTGGSDPQFTSWGSPPTIGLRCGNKIFAYNAAANQVGTVTTASGSLAPQASPDGSRFFFPTSGSSAQVRDFNMAVTATVSGDAEEHGTITQTANGAAFVAVQFDAREGIWSYPLSRAAPKLIYGPGNGWPYPPTGTHVSGVNYRKPGWIVVAHVGQLPLGSTLLENEIVLANVDTGQMCRVAHSRTYAGNGNLGYFSEAHPVLSPSGTRIAFTSDWGGQANAETYVVELPGYAAP